VLGGGTGYVAGELLRLLYGHPVFRIAAVSSDSQPGQPVASAFPHLAAALGDMAFASQEEVLSLASRLPRAAVFSAAPHGVSAELVDTLLERAESAGARPTVVDISADYRFRDAGAYEAVYRHAHGAPGRLGQFSCAVPEHLARLATPHVAHPGCFATATLLAVVPLLALGLSEPELYVAGVTGSTGAGRTPTPGTHHPQRHSDLYTYNVLAHRHAPEIRSLARTASGVDAEIAFVPHSGPFARGIHVTVQGRLRRAAGADELRAALAGFYAGKPFVRVLPQPPRVKDVVASNYAQLAVATDGRSVAVMSVLDNLVKGAAGGAIQWMNRLFDLDETAGLTAPAPGWT